jgi:hypothetical protein
MLAKSKCMGAMIMPSESAGGASCAISCRGLAAQVVATRATIMGKLANTQAVSHARERLSRV